LEGVDEVVVVGAPAGGEGGLGGSEESMVASDKVRFAQLGVDHPHAAGLRQGLTLLPEIEVAGFYDPNPASARALIAAPLQDRPVYGDLAACLGELRPEAVLVTLPNDLAAPAIAAAARAGCHIYAEKPSARTAAEFHPAAAAVGEAGVQFTTGYLRRLVPAGVAIKDIVDRGLLGRLVSIEARWITTSVAKRHPGHFLFSRERSGGGMLHWLGSHWLDFMRWSTSSEVAEVAAVMGTLSGEAIDVEDTATLALRFDNGMVGSLHVAYTTDKATDQLFFGLRGTLGWVNWERSGPEIEVRSTHPAWAPGETRVMRFTSDPVEGYGGAVGMIALRRFISSFRDGAAPVFTPDDSLRILEVLDAAQESSQTGRRIPIGHLLVP
jgi:predicted dehydrogenase